jgi:hypothetical protein
MIREKIKELDKSLHQIELAKTSANDLFFAPSGNNIDFLICLGLEEVVKHVLDNRAPLTSLENVDSGNTNTTTTTTAGASQDNK